MDYDVKTAERGPFAVWALACAAMVALMVYLRIWVYPDAFVPLTYAVPLMVWLWYRDLRLLWAMAGAFLVTTVWKMFVVLPPEHATITERWIFGGMQVVNIGVAAGVIHAVIVMSRREEATARRLAASNAELEASNEELAAREEEISRQNEELQQQAAELEQQTEEVSAQAEELQALNEQLALRERSLNDLLEISTGMRGGAETLAALRGAVEKMLGARAAGAALLEARGGMMVVRPVFGVDESTRTVRRERTLGEIVMERDRAGFIADLALRPDLDTPRLTRTGGETAVARSVIAAPLRVTEAGKESESGAGYGSGYGAGVGALEVYSLETGEWSEQDLRLLQWFAQQCGRMWATARLREDLAAQSEVLRTVTDNSPAALFLTNEDGGCTFLNPAAEKMFGVSLEELRNKTLHEALHGRRPDGAAYPAAECPIEQALERNQEVRGHEDVFFKKDGSALPVQCAARPILRDGRRVATVVEVRDVTEQRSAAREREDLLDSERAARTEAERAGRMKDEFVATLSHELRTPLNAILGWSGLLRKSLGNPEELSKGLEVIERNARQQGQLISDLLDISRINAGKIRLDVQAVDLPLVIEGALDSIRPAAEAKGVQLDRVIEPVDRVVTGDPSRLQQVVWNLLSNAVKFTPRGGRVQVVLARVASYVQITVSDTGPGIAAELLGHLFERYRQGDSSSTRRSGGLGLGLSIVKHLVELHGGTVHARSEGEGKGAAFTVLLPVRAVEPHEEASGPHPQAAGAMSWAGDAPMLKGARILLVDDEQDARDVVCRILVDRGAKVEAAASADEALEKLEKGGDFNLLISDIGMPGTDGYTLMRRIRERYPQSVRTLPAIAITAFARSEDRTRALLAGFQSHISKPLEPVELIATVASLMASLGTKNGNGNGNGDGPQRGRELQPEGGGR